MAATRQILVIDDDDGIREFVSIALSDEGYEVLTAPHGAAALDVLSQYSPTLILLDMRMPVMDGWEFARAYRERPGPHSPIVVFTAARESATRATQIDAEGVLAKPFGLAELFEIVAAHTPGGESDSRSSVSPC